MRVVINSCYGGFGLSDAGMTLLAKKKGWEVVEYEAGEGFTCMGRVKYLIDQEGKNVWDSDLKREDLDLISTIEELKETTDGFASSLSIVEIPDGTDYVIQEYDGSEWIAERHETWS